MAYNAITSSANALTQKWTFLPYSSNLGVITAERVFDPGAGMGIQLIRLSHNVNSASACAVQVLDRYHKHRNI